MRVPEHAALVRDFLNTLDRLLGRDAFGSLHDLRGWFVERGLAHGDVEIRGRDVLTLTTLRAELRELLRRHGDEHPPEPDVEPLNTALTHCPVVVAFGADGVPRLAGRSSGTIGDAIAPILDAVLASAADGSWERLRVCRRPGCGRAFYDGSRGRNGRWCSMARCGNQQKQQRARRPR